MTARILPDPYQIAAADPDQSVFVTANAGSGKTSTLVDRVARLLLKQVQPGEILCVTYTRAAAAEMQARLFERLGDWAVMDDDALAQSLADLGGHEHGTSRPEALSRARQLFAKALDTPGGLKIQTIHAFCEKLLRRFPIEAGITPGFTVLENEAAAALSQGARDELARRALADFNAPLGRAYSHFAVELDWKAFQALLGLIETDRVKLTDYTARVVAGTAPGPHALTGADPDVPVEALEQDFMRWVDRDQWRAMAAAMATGSTNDQKCADRMRAAAWTFDGIAPVFLTEKREDRASVATAKAPPAARDWLVDLQRQYLAVLETVRKAKVAADTVHVLTLAEAHARLYEQAKAARSALDFGDLVARTVDLLTVQASAAWVLYKLDGGIEHVLVDEAQDTAPQQWDIIRALTEGFFSGDSGRVPRVLPTMGQLPARTVFAVGDEKQSIYSFQGARPERLRQESHRYDGLVTGSGLKFTAVELATSFRSTPEVLAFVDRVFDNPVRTAALVGEEIAAISPHRAKRASDPGCVELWPLFEDQKPPEPDAWDPVDQEPATSGRKQLAAKLAAGIRHQVETGVAVHDRKTGVLRPCGYGDFLILVRRRDPTFEEIIRALKSAGVPVAGADRLKLSSHIVFDDLIALARFALYPDDELSLAGILRSPFCDVDEDSLFELAGRDPERANLWTVLCTRAQERPEWSHARDFLLQLIGTRDRDPFGFFSGLLNRVDAGGLSGRARILRRLGVEAGEAIDETLNQVLSAEDRGGIDLETCLALLEAADVEVKRELEGARDEVRVMTVHGAKGLEAPVVILPDTTSRAKAQGPSLMPVALEDGSEAWLMCPGSETEDCPASRTAREARQERTDAESLRLLYVALTRARDRVVIMGRALGKPKIGFEDRSWWTVIEETFGRLGDAVRDLDDGIRRFGPDPAVLTSATAPRAETVLAPGWMTTSPSPDPGMRFAAPSRMDEALRIPAPSPLATTAGPGAPLGRFRRGDLIHRLLERLPDIPLAGRRDAAHRMLSRERDLDDPQRIEMIEAAFRVLDDARFAPVFGSGSRPEVALTGSVGAIAVSGRMDRLVITPDRVLVIDYKTNRPAPTRIEEADPAYVRQLAVYVSILGRLYPDRPIEAALVWTDGPQLMAVPRTMLEAALEA
jgi:ATP-dependent helicase/nuclease subunit A